jgi:hypothetical protein
VTLVPYTSRLTGSNCHHIPNCRFTYAASRMRATNVYAIPLIKPQRYIHFRLQTDNWTTQSVTWHHVVTSHATTKILKSCTLIRDPPAYTSTESCSIPIWRKCFKLARPIHFITKYEKLKVRHKVHTEFQAYRSTNWKIKNGEQLQTAQWFHRGSLSFNAVRLSKTIKSSLHTTWRHTVARAI